MKKLLAISLLLFSATAFAVDSDGDGVDDSVDAFPNDGCASVDTDGDGKPNAIVIAGSCLFEDFEMGFTAHPWVSSPAWTLVAWHGGAGARQTYKSATTFLSLTHTFTTATTLRFFFNNNQYADGKFYVDGITQSILLGYTEWTQISVPISAGTHTLKWEAGTRSCPPITCITNILVDDIFITSLIEDTDDDNDGVLDTSDKFPLDPTETLDNDNDDIGNNADTDDDNDLMPDTWETTYGLNPLVNDASGDLDGDGLTNLQEYNNGSNPTTVVTDKNDYNNDGIAGWIWKGVSSGNGTASQNWQLTFPLYSPNWAVPNRFYAPIFPDQANWEIATTGDFNKDGDADILWRHLSTAEWKVWQMQSGLRVAQNSPPDFDLAHEWVVVGAGDTDKDGDDDVVLNNTTTGEVLVWQMQNHAVAATHVVGTKAGYTLNRIGDFNKDGDVDLLFRQNSAEVLITWEIDANAFVTERALANTGTGYNPVCAGDFDKDGDDDIMLVNSGTTQEKWFVMENFVRSQVVGSTNTGFVFKGCGDYDGDGDADILWQRSADDANRVILQQNYGASKQTVYTNAFGAVSGFVYRGNSN
jgi:hypothetical protein